jgi:hypothetical protein
LTPNATKIGSGNLRQACDSYEAAHALRPASHAALYNWGVALSDMARHLKAVNPGASYDFLLAATDKYGQSLKWNPNNPQVRCTRQPGLDQTSGTTVATSGRGIRNSSLLKRRESCQNRA